MIFQYLGRCVYNRLVTFATANSKSSCVTWTLLSLKAYIPASVHTPCNTHRYIIFSSTYFAHMISHSRSHWNMQIYQTFSTLNQTRNCLDIFNMHFWNVQLSYYILYVFFLIKVLINNYKLNIAQPTLTSAPEAPGIISAIFLKLIPRVRFIFLEWIFRMSRRAWNMKRTFQYYRQELVINYTIFVTYCDLFNKMIHERLVTYNIFPATHTWMNTF